MAALQKVTLVGAAGNLGQALLKRLLAGGFQVQILSRTDSSSKFENVPAVNVIRGDYTPEFFLKALKGQDVLVLAIGSDALDAQKDIITAAAEVGVKRIVPSEFGGDITNPLSLKALPFNEGKLLIAEHLEKVLATHPQTTWTAVVCGPFFDWCLERDLFGIDVRNHKATLYDQGANRFDTTNLDTVGKAVTKFLSMPDKYQNERIFISGMRVTQLDILNALKRATNVKDWNVQYESAESMRAIGQAKVAAHDYSGMIEIISASLFQDGNGSLFSADRKLANEDLGVKDDLDETVKQYVQSL